jgi:hypothetical protein
MTFTCRAVNLGRRWLCTSEDGTKTWIAGPDYKYLDKLASEAFETGPTTPPIPIETEPGVTPTEPPILLPKPAEGYEKPGGWGANKDPDTWTITRMKDDPTKFKVVDDKGKNVATHFTSKQSAQYYIDYYQQIDGEGEEPNEPGDKPDEPPKPEPEPPAQEGTTVKGPYSSTGKELQSTQRGPTTRNYASGKPSDETVEKNVKNIKARNHQFITYVTMHKIEHDDTMSQKIGGTHMGTGWFVNSIEFESGLCGIGVEKKHPSTSHNDVKGGKIGSILNKKIGMASVYFADQNKVELWTDTGVDGKWVKQCEGVNVKGFNPNASTFECQLRIDGFQKGSVPTMHIAVVQPIAAP